MKKIIVLLFLAFAVFACHRKTVADSDIIISNKTKRSEKPNTITPTHPDPADPAKPGSVIYTNRCGRCHALKPVAKYTSAEWENILKSMIPKAKLNETEANQVRAYLKEHAKK